MKRRHLGWAALCLNFLLAGCELVFQAGTGISGQAREDYLKSIKPYLQYWEKEGWTEEGRLADWVACGGSRSGNFAWDTRKQRLGESNEQSSVRQSQEHQRCLIQRGYRYTGNCSSAYMKAQPLCGAP
jgi:hypothetical protein